MTSIKNVCLFQHNVIFGYFNSKNTDASFVMNFKFSNWKRDFFIFKSDFERSQIKFVPFLLYCYTRSCIIPVSLWLWLFSYFSLIFFFNSTQARAWIAELNNTRFPPEHFSKEHLKLLFDWLRELPINIKWRLGSSDWLSFRCDRDEEGSDWWVLEALMADFRWKCELCFLSSVNRSFLIEWEQLRLSDGNVSSG